MRYHDLHTAGLSCSVVIGDGAWSDLAALAAGASAAVLISDRRVAAEHACNALHSLSARGLPAYRYDLPPGDRSKTWRLAAKIYDCLAERAIDRQGLIVALGGGMVTDVAGFVAGTWLRGVRLINCPTTLLCAVDAGLGGKTALNHAGRKNCIGTFHDPSAVVIDLAALRTLTDRRFRCGMAESLKHAVIADWAFLDWQVENATAILAREDSALEELIFRNIRIKAAIVATDPRETTGDRAKLNFGHTIGHALEAHSGFRQPHGECVALGMMGAMFLALARGLLDASFVDRVRRALDCYGLPTRLAVDVDEDVLLRLVDCDKKAVEGRARFVLPTSREPVLVGQEVSQQEIRQAIEKLRTS